MNDFEPPKKEIMDKFISLVSAASFVVPGGNSLIELVIQFLGTPYQHRRDQWIEKVAETLKELTESEGFRLDDLPPGYRTPS